MFLKVVRILYNGLETVNFHCQCHQIVEIKGLILFTMVSKIINYE